MADSGVRKRILGRRAIGDVCDLVRRRRGGPPPKELGKAGTVVPVPEGDDFVIGHLRSSPSVYNHQRGGDHLHVSDLLGKCVRKLALARRFGTSLPPERINDGLGLTFAQGDAIHDFVKNRVAAGHPDKMYGTWGCTCGASRTDTMRTLAGAAGMSCGKCGSALTQYHEARIVDEEYGIVGSPDFLLYLERLRAYHITEVKSISGTLFKELVRPQPNHVLQVTFYWHLMNRAGFSLTDRASILYSNKEFSFKSPYREFSVDAPDQAKRLEPYIEDAKAYKASLGGGPLPLRSVCATPDTTEAKSCPLRDMCFASK